MDTGAHNLPMPSRPERALDLALTLHAPLARKLVARLRNSRPNATPAEIVSRLNAELRTSTILAGAGVGATAAAPGVGTGVSLALSGAEAVAFIDAVVVYVLARSQVHGISTEDLERRRMLILGIFLGDAGTQAIRTVAERTGQHWAKLAVTKIPYEKVLAINKVLGKNFVTKYGTKQGIVVLGRVIPFGVGLVIGGTANAIFSQAIISSSNRAFGPAPTNWELSTIDDE